MKTEMKTALQKLRAVSQWDDLGQTCSTLKIADICVATVQRRAAWRKYPICWRVEVLGNGFVCEWQPTIDDAKREAENVAAKDLAKLGRLLGGVR
jgi:hypothetical protein